MTPVLRSFCRPAEAAAMLSGTQAAAAECEDGELLCRVAVEELSPGGQPRRRQSLRTAELSLGRNERRELMLRLQAPGPAGRPRCFPVRAARLFTRFAAAGRSTLRFPADSTPRATACAASCTRCASSWRRPRVPGRPPPARSCLARGPATSSASAPCSPRSCGVRRPPGSRIPRR